MRQFRLPNRIFIRASPKALIFLVRLGRLDFHALMESLHEAQKSLPGGRWVFPLNSQRDQVGAKFTLVRRHYEYTAFAK